MGRQLAHADGLHHRQLTWLRNQTPDWPRITETDPDAAWGQFLAQDATLTGLD